MLSEAEASLLVVRHFGDPSASVGMTRGMVRMTVEVVGVTVGLFGVMAGLLG
jgi:hypothetical protein